MATRVERDSMGPVEVPADALYGAQTRRAELNFPISGWRLPPPFLRTLGRIKRTAAAIHRDAGRLEPRLADWIEVAAGEVADGLHDEQFVVDVFQTGSGTSTHMNANEVIANRAIQLAGGEVGSRDPVHPNDHVNMGQSSNDVIPTALQVALLGELQGSLLPSLRQLRDSLAAKGRELDDVVTIGRTHLQDATPVRLGQVLGGLAALVEAAVARVEAVQPALCQLPIGGTAVGTGLNAPPGFGAEVARRLGAELGLPLVEAGDHFAAQGAQDATVNCGAALKTVAVTLTKVANDLRWLASGPRCGIGELELPAVQPGSSIMPGKINPVICESVMQVAAFVVGADASVSHAAATLSNFELCTALPLMAHQLLESVRLLAAASDTLVERAVRDLQADEARCEALIEGSLALCTGLAPLIGYDAAAEIAHEAHRSGRTVREVASQSGLLDDETLERALDPRAMTGERGS